MDQPKTQEVMDYLTTHELTQKLNDVVNAAVKARTEDPFGYMADEFRKLAKPATVSKLVGRQVLDSRGNPTVEVDVYANVNGREKMAGRGVAPSGASTGSNEAFELRDNDESLYLGRGVLKAVENVNTELSGAVAGIELTNLGALDEAMINRDGTEMKTKLGGNAITAASFALANAGADTIELPLFEHFANAFYKEGQVPVKFSMPVPMVNILNGGKHAGGDLKIQEFMILPRRDITFEERMRYVTTVYHHLGHLVAEKYGKSAKNLGDEGGFAPSLSNADEALSIIEEAIQSAGFEVGEDIKLALDCAASEFYDKEKEMYEIAPDEWLSSDQLLEYYKNLVEKHPALVSIEDGFDEKDYYGWKAFVSLLGDKIMIVGDDLFTTNTKLIEEGLKESWANSLLLKVNQIGTITESMKAARLLFEKEGNVIVSHRSGETPGHLISDLAVGIGAQYIKTGAPARGERVAKYNRLLQIEEYLQAKGMLQN